MHLKVTNATLADGLVLTDELRVLKDSSIVERTRFAHVPHPVVHMIAECTGRRSLCPCCAALFFPQQDRCSAESLRCAWLLR